VPDRFGELSGDGAQLLVDGVDLAVRKSPRGRSGVRAVDVDHQWAAADHGHDDLLRAVERVDVTMYESRGHVEEPASLDVHRCGTARAELEPRPPDDDIAEDVTRAMMVRRIACPTRSFGASGRGPLSPTGHGA
jgi:hypothetical protein